MQWLPKLLRHDIYHFPSSTDFGQITWPSLMSRIKRSTPPIGRDPVERIKRVSTRGQNLHGASAQLPALSGTKWQGEAQRHGTWAQALLGELDAGTVHCWRRQRRTRAPRYTPGLNTLLKSTGYVPDLGLAAKPSSSHLMDAHTPHSPDRRDCNVQKSGGLLVMWFRGVVNI